MTPSPPSPPAGGPDPDPTSRHSAPTGTVRGALAFSAAGTYVQLALQTVTTLIIARLITPADLALFAIGSALVALVQVLRDFGIASYVIREAKLTDALLSSAFFVSLVLCWLLALVLFGLSGYAGTFYGHTGVTSVVRVLAIGIALVPFGSVSLAVLQRKLAFGRVFVINVVSAIVHAATSILMAKAGYGALAMAWASVFGLAASAVTTRLVAGRVFKFTLERQQVRNLFSFGSRMTQIQIVRVAQSRSPELILGKLLPLGALGIFERANGVLDMFDRLVMQAVDPLVMPYLSDKARRGNALAQANLTATGLVASVAVPFYAFVAAAATPMVYVLFGSQWLQSAELVPILCLVAVVRVPTQFAARLAVVGDRLDLSRMAFTVTAIAQVVALVLSARAGLIVICSALVVSSVVHSLVWSWVSRTVIGNSGYWHAVRAALLPAVLVGLGTLTANRLGDRLELPHLLTLAICAAVACGAWLAGLRLGGNLLYAEIVNVLNTARLWMHARRPRHSP